jgi:hypothetical protein
MTQESQYEYRKRKENEKRIAEATANGNGYVILPGPQPRFPLKEAWRPTLGAPLQIAGEHTPAAANPNVVDVPKPQEENQIGADADAYYRKI